MLYYLLRRESVHSGLCFVRFLFILITGDLYEARGDSRRAHHSGPFHEQSFVANNLRPRRSRQLLHGIQNEKTNYSSESISSVRATSAAPLVTCACRKRLNLCPSLSLSPSLYRHSNKINVDEEVFDALRLSQPADLPPMVLLPVEGGPDPRTNLTDEVSLQLLSSRCFWGEGVTLYHR